MEMIESEERAERRREMVSEHTLPAFLMARAAVRSFVAEMGLGAELRVRVVAGDDGVVSRADLHALAYDNTNSDARKAAVVNLSVAAALHVSYGEREPHLMFPAWKTRPPLYTRDLLRLL